MAEEITMGRIAWDGSEMAGVFDGVPSDIAMAIQAQLGSAALDGWTPSRADVEDLIARAQAARQAPDDHS